MTPTSIIDVAHFTRTSSINHALHKRRRHFEKTDKVSRHMTCDWAENIYKETIYCSFCARHVLEKVTRGPNFESTEP